MLKALSCARSNARINLKHEKQQISKSGMLCPELIEDNIFYELHLLDMLNRIFVHHSVLRV